MNKLKAHQILSWLLLLFFVAGQGIIYAHQHHSKYNALIVNDHHAAKQQIVQEKCYFCYQMHHEPIHLEQALNYCQIKPSVSDVYYASQHHYKGNTLVHADGLSPPVLV